MSTTSSPAIPTFDPTTEAYLDAMDKVDEKNRELIAFQEEQIKFLKAYLAELKLQADQADQAEAESMDS